MHRGEALVKMQFAKDFDVLCAYIYWYICTLEK